MTIGTYICADPEFFSGGGGGGYLVCRGLRGIRGIFLCKFKKFDFPRGFLPYPAPTRFAHEKMQRQDFKLYGHPTFLQGSNIALQITFVMLRG